MLAAPQDAEDAFQATFLVLVEHSGWFAARNRWQAGCTAWRIGFPVVLAQPRRGGRSTNVKPRQSREHKHLPSEPDRAELRAIVAEELSRLSRPQRLAVVLCDLEELTHEQAAAQLGWP